MGEGFLNDHKDLVRRFSANWRHLVISYLCIFLTGVIINSQFLPGSDLPYRSYTNVYVAFSIIGTHLSFADLAQWGSPKLSRHCPNLLRGHNKPCFKDDVCHSHKPWSGTIDFIVVSIMILWAKGVGYLKCNTVQRSQYKKGEQS